MPTTPTVIPLIVAGLILGSLLVSEKRKMSKKKFLGVSLLGGLLNAANAFIVYTLFPPTTFSRFGGGNFGGGSFAGGTFTGSSTFRGAAGASSETSFLLLSFITGLLIVIVVVGVALAYVRYKGAKGEEQLDETGEEEQEELEEPKHGKEQEEL
jgi:hypothetical protein